MKRKGFVLIPDYACTAHMVQGRSLDALLADCGDIMDTPRLKDMLAAYVALSRARRAEALLLLRGFPKNLFRQGPPPGPHCLMRLLRARLISKTSNARSSADAKAEYTKLMDEKTIHKENLKEANLQWCCFDCGHTCNAEGFGAQAKQHEEILAKCMKPGQWLACIACTAAHNTIAMKSELYPTRR